MLMSDLLNAGEVVGVRMTAGGGLKDDGQIEGRYSLECHDENGNLVWVETIDNMVVTGGQNQLLAAGLQGSTPAYMGLIAGATGTVAATDTMASHAGWVEADSSHAPAYSGNRAPLTFGAASGGSMTTTSTNSFEFTNSGTVCGAFIVLGSGASNTPGDTNGVLLSAGTIATAQPVISGNTITMSYTLTL